jgi:DNA-binding NarL/FixJ family response regulator
VRTITIVIKAWAGFFSQESLEVVGQAKDGPATVELAAVGAQVVVDISMPGLNGIEATG